MPMIISFQTILPTYLWGWDGNNCQLLISFEAPELGGWKNVLTPFETTGLDIYITHTIDSIFSVINSATPDGIIILEGQLQLETRIIKQYNYRFPYKYHVFTKISQRSFEHIIHSSLLPGVKYVNRLLLIPENVVAQGGNDQLFNITW